MIKINIIKSCFILCISISSPFFCHSNNSKTDSLSCLLKQNIDDTNKVNLLNSLALEYIRISPDSSLFYSEKAEALSHQLNWKKGSGNSYHNTGYAHYALGNYDKTLFHWLKALEVREELGDKNGISSSLGNIATVYLYMGNHPKALEFNFKALKLDEETGNKDGVETILNNIGNIYKYQHDYSKALEYYFKVLKIMENSGNNNNLGPVLSNIGIIYKNQNDFSHALEYFFKALKINEESGNKNYVSVILGNIGIVYKNMEDYTKALEFYFRALKLSEELNSKNNILSWIGNIGVIYTKQRNFKEAEFYLLKALKMSDSIGVLSERMHLENSLAEFYFEKGDNKRAYEFHKKYTSTKDSLFNEEKNKQITEMQTKYDTEKKENENFLLTMENEVKDLEISEQKTQKYLLFGSIFLIILISFLVYNRYKLKQQKILSEEMLKQEKLRTRSMLVAQELERKRIAEDLHDGISQMLSAVKLNVSSLEGNSGKDYQVQYKNAIDLIDNSCTELRNISHNMMPGLLVKAGLIPAIADLADKLISPTLRIFVDADGFDKRLKSDMEIHVFRIVQELLNNITKYASASEIHIQLNINPTDISIMVEDNGKWFDKNILKISKGNGWNNINSRLEILNARIEIDSQAGKGTVIFIQVPLIN